MHRYDFFTVAGVRTDYLHNLQKKYEAALIMRDVGVKDSSLRGVFKKYLKFFDNKERYKEFASFHMDNPTEEKIDIAVLSALCKLPVVDFEQVVKKILLPMVSAVEINTVPPELFSKFQISFYQSPRMRCLRRWGLSRCF